MAEKKNEQKKDLDTETRIYEIGYLLVPTLADEEVGGIVAGLKDSVRDSGGVVLGEGEPKMKNLAYKMAKAVGHDKKYYDTAYFGWMSFELSADALGAVVVAVDGNTSVLRALCLKITREEALPRKKASVARKKKTFSKESASETLASSAEIDKAIEDMVVDDTV